ncbi:dynamin family protein [Butyrivibrio sp. INlla16]|uniref:dynamin family protein n=1 Tax=Butyrivibrio sp. INlla16 TaxID=1520807 RepID=UPI000882ED16|nr:dynamin family protein [Butyrivibrio sp. INlla16]SDB13879.1 Dynamin family protein [Butyrivibrio sp. INlla16]
MQGSGSLVSKDFFPENLEFDVNRIFPMVVVATMSSGKSTLINALLGKDILPNRNAACTSLPVSILDDDRPTKESVFITNKAGQTSVTSKDIDQVLEKANEDTNVKSIFIRSHIKGVLNTDRALLVIDTPGPNNSQNSEHEQALWGLMDKINGGLILYVLNATQLGINDDKYLIGEIKKLKTAKPNLSVIFALNKMDEIDEEYESVEDYVKTANRYLTENGFEGSTIIPVSAMAAMVFKKALAGTKMTRSECNLFEAFYSLYVPNDYSMKKYAITPDLKMQFETIEVKGKTYRIGDLNQALENTGISILEDCIQKAQIMGGKRLKNTIRIKG